MADQSTAERVTFYRVTALVFMSLAVLLAAVMVIRRQVAIDIASFWPVLLTGLPLLAGHFYYRSWRNEPYLATVLGCFVSVLLGGLAVAVASIAALHHGAPLIDAQLGYFDETLGLDSRVFVRFVASYPLFGQILQIAYLSPMPIFVLLLAFYPAFGRSEQVWEYAAVFTVTVTLAAVVSLRDPAIGPFTHYAMAPQTLGGLPQGAGVYYVPLFTYYREADDPIIRLTMLTGVVTFPSFHACMGLMTAWALRSLPVVRWLAWPWCVLVLAATLPIGGHYTIDVIAGSGLWLITMAALRVLPMRFARGEPMSHVA